MLPYKQALLPKVPLYSVARQRHVTKMGRATFNGNGNRYFQAIKTVNICRVEISPKHKLSYPTNQILNDTSHVLRGPLLQRYGDVLGGQYDPHQEGLWVMCTSNTMQGPKVVRSWARRRIAQALVEELKSKGYDRRGKRVESVGDIRENSKAKEEGDMPEMLVGTVAIETLPKSLEVKYKEVQRQAGLIVKEILKTCDPRRKGNSKKKSSLLNDEG